jgi:hypothetical protein
VDVAMVVAGNFAAGGTDTAGIVSDTPAEDGLNECQCRLSSATAGYAFEDVRVRDFTGADGAPKNLYNSFMSDNISEWHYF